MGGGETSVASRIEILCSCLSILYFCCCFIKTKFSTTTATERKATMSAAYNEIRILRIPDHDVVVIWITWNGSLTHAKYILYEL